MKMENTLCLEKWKFSLTLLLYEAIREKLFCRVIFQFLAFFFLTFGSLREIIRLDYTRACHTNGERHSCLKIAPQSNFYYGVTA